MLSHAHAEHVSRAQPESSEKRILLFFVPRAAAMNGRCHYEVTAKQNLSGGHLGFVSLQAGASQSERACVYR